jgi:hypothetical protein
MTLAIGTTTANLPHDVFLFNNSGTLTLQHVVWTNATTRATDIVLQDGVYVKSGATTHLYLGTFHTTSTTETQDTVGGSATNVGGKRFLWNLYNQVPREMRVYDETNAWSYEDDTIRQARNQSGSKCECVIGVPGTIIDAQVHSVVSIITNTVRAAKVGPGIDSTSTFATGSLIQGGFNTNDNIFAPVMGRYAGPLGIGYHYISWNEKGGADGDCFFVGDNGGDSQQTGMIVRFLN